MSSGSQTLLYFPALASMLNKLLVLAFYEKKGAFLNRLCCLLCRHMAGDYKLITMDSRY